MSDSFDIYTLIFLVVAVVIFLRLRSVLGRRTGSERQPYDPYSAENKQNGPASAGGQKSGTKDNVVHLPRNDDAPVYGIQQTDAEILADKIKGFAPKDSPLAESLTAIINTDKSFLPAEFIQGAKTAYEMIVMAFADGNSKTLKPLLNAEVYDSFDGAINEREDRGETIDSSFVGISRATIIDVELKDKFTHITVKFVSELITAVRDKDGDVIDGDPAKIKEVTDIWTFARDTTSNDPNWKLVATETAN